MIKKTALKTWKVLSGLLMKFKQDGRELLKNPSIEALHKFNKKKYNFCSDQIIKEISDLEEIKTMRNRPSRMWYGKK